jgi:predicted peroxiredoxin
MLPARPVHPPGSLRQVSAPDAASLTGPARPEDPAPGYRPARPNAGATSSAGPASGGPAVRPLVVKVTCGTDRPEAANQAFTVAATAVAAGARVSLWLTGEASWFALPGRAADFVLPHAAPLADLLDAVLAEGSVTLCTQCAARRVISQRDVLPGVRIAGAPVFVEEVLAPGVQALVY